MSKALFTARAHVHTISHIHKPSGSRARDVRPEFWSRKPSGCSKWRSPPSSLPLTLLINISRADLRRAHHKVTSYSTGFPPTSFTQRDSLFRFTFSFYLSEHPKSESPFLGPTVRITRDSSSASQLRNFSPQGPQGCCSLPRRFASLFPARPSSQRGSTKARVARYDALKAQLWLEVQKQETLIY